MDEKLLRSLKNIKPIRIYKIGTVVFNIYKAKNLYTPVWNSGVLKKITKIARRSYLRYGRVPLTDDYDKNAAIYLCRANYNGVEEWLSLRFVPGDTKDHSLEDLDQYLYAGRSIADIIKKKLVLKNNNPAYKSVAISRLCGISPPSAGKRYTAQAFALINKEFFSDTHFSYLVGMFRPEISAKVLHFSSRLDLSFPDAYKLLKCRPNQIYLDRSSLAYRFPGYFLNVAQLIKFLQKLIKENKISFSFIKKYAKNFTPGIIKVKNYTEILKMISGISAVLLWKGKIPGSKISGEELRALAGQSVEDGSKLKIVSVSNWIKQLSKIKVAVINQ